MRFGLISDVHGDLESLKSAFTRLSGMDRIVCLGDVCGGPHSEECLRYLREHSIKGVPGNHDLWSFERTGLSKESSDYLLARPLELRQADFLAVHSMYEARGEEHHFSYVFSERDARGMWERFSEPIIFFGHTHLAQLHWLGPSGETGFAKARAGLECAEGLSYEFPLLEGHRYLVNVPAICEGFVTYDQQARTVRYLFHKIAAAARGANLIATPKPTSSWWARLRESLRR